MIMKLIIDSKKKKIQKLMEATSFPISNVIYSLLFIEAIYNNKTGRFEVPRKVANEAIRECGGIKEKSGIVNNVYWELTDEYFTFWLK